VAARDLARTGAAVALIDGSHPREKPCGGGVTGRALELVQIAAPGRPIRTVRFDAGGRSTTVPLPGDYLEVFSRDAFDRALLDEARQAGAQFAAVRATGLDRTAQGWEVRLADGATLTAPWLLGADGAGGMVRKKVLRPFERAQLSIAAGSYVDGSDISEIVIRFVDDPRGYLWSFPRPGHLAVGTCAQADVATTATMHAVTDAWLDTYPAAAGLPRRRYAWPIPSLSASDLDAEQPSGPGWMLLGDAAGLVDPITREGIYFALRSGILAARSLAAADPSRAYAAAVRDELHDELRRAARLKAGFFRPRFTSLLIEALDRSPAVREVMIDLVAGRQPYRGLKRRLLATMELGLAVRLLRSR
jgi:flavin-dependent dehydrogenase